MIERVLITGAMFRRPETRTSSRGSSYVVATVKVKDGDDARFWKVICFSETAQAELMRMGDGEALSLQGSLKIETYEKNGETKISFGLTAEHVLALRAAPKERTKKPAEPKPSGGGMKRIGEGPRPAAAPSAFNDEVPF